MINVVLADNGPSEDVKKPDLKKIAELIKYLQEEFQLQVQLNQVGNNSGVLAVRIRKQPGDALSQGSAGGTMKGEKLSSYFNLAMKCLQNIFETLGISYLFKPIELPQHKRNELLTVLDVLKHAYGLSFFTETF